MIFHTKLYVGERVKSLRRIKNRLKSGKLLKHAHVITFASGNDLLEIYDAKVFIQKYYMNFPRMIVGIAADYDEAVELVIKIMEETLNSRGDCNVKAYLSDNM